MNRSSIVAAPDQHAFVDRQFGSCTASLPGREYVMIYTVEIQDKAGNTVRKEYNGRAEER